MFDSDFLGISDGGSVVTYITCNFCGLRDIEEPPQLVPVTRCFLNLKVFQTCEDSPEK